MQELPRILTLFSVAHAIYPAYRQNPGKIAIRQVVTIFCRLQRTGIGDVVCCFWMSMFMGGVDAEFS